MFRHILVPLDGSRFAEKAIPYACDLADSFDSQITLVSVVDPPSLPTEAWAEHIQQVLLQVRENTRNRLTLYLQKMQKTLQAEGYTVSGRLLENGPAAEALLTTMANEDVDIVVMSTHGHTGVARWVLGSVAERIVRHADVPVLLVRVRADETDDVQPATQALPEHNGGF
jgi:nucleotide-binding universal stress UspA family protein